MRNGPPRLLVVGGSGFIGRHVVNHARGLGWHVTSLSLQPEPEPHDRGISHVAADIRNRAALRGAIGTLAFEYVVNCGGYIDHTLYSQGGRSVLDVHLQGVLNLVAIIDRHVLQAFVNLGSSDEYGNAPAPQQETQREAAISPYSLGKVAATHFLQMLFRSERYPATTLRLFLTYGPGQDDRRFLPQIILGCLSGSTFPVSPGEQLRDFCYVQDTVNAVFLALGRTSALGEVINIGSGRPLSIRQVVEAVRHLIGLGVPKFGEIEYRLGENMALYPDVSKAKSILGWEPGVSFESGLEKTISWFREYR